MTAKKTLLLLSLVVLLGSAPVGLFGQGEAGGIRGTLADPSGAPVPNATIRATNISTGVITSTVSTSAGLYNLAPLPAGVYRVEAVKTGFETLVRTNITVPVAVVVGVNLTLQVGATTQTIEVHAASPTVETQTSQVDTVVPPKAYIDLPLNASGGRSSLQFVALAAGDYASSSFSATANGGQIFSRQLRVDGLDVGNVLAQPGDDTKVMTFAPDAVQELTYVTLDPAAEYGNNEGGVVNQVIRSGTNQLHGSAYEFNTGNYLQARNFLEPSLTTFNRNEYGFTVGGPIYLPHIYDGRNRTFFFFDFDGWSTRSAPSTSFLTLPTKQEANGDFSDYPYPIYNPATTQTLPNGTVTRQQFPGNIIPAGDISPISAKIAAVYPTVPDGSPLTNNYLNTSVDNVGFKEETFKIDEELGSRQHIAFTFNSFHEPQRSCSYFCSGLGPSGQASIASGIQEWNGITPKHNFDHLDYDLTISPGTLFHTTLGLERYSQYQMYDNFGKGWNTIVGIPNTGNGPFPYIGLDQYPSPGIGGTGDNEEYVGSVPQADWDFVLVRGRNTIQFGGEHQFFANEHVQPTTTGSFTFSPLESGLPGVTDSGNAFASFLQGTVDSGTRHIQNIATDAIYWDQALYAQDDYKLSSKATVNAGLRWALYAPYYDRGNYLSTMDPNTPNPGCGGCKGALVFAGSGLGRTGTRRLTPPLDTHDFMPRLGLAYALKPNLVLRTGYALLDEMPGAAGSYGVRWSDLGFTADPTFSSLNAGVTPAFNWENGFPAFTSPPFIDPAFALGSDVSTYYGLNASAPGRLNQWHLGVQYSFKPNWLLDVGYVGSEGYELLSGDLNINQVNPKYLSLGSLLEDSITSPAVVAAGFKPPYPGFTGTLAQSLRPYPQYLYIQTGGQIGAPWLGGAQDGNSNYNSLQIKLQHNFSHGLYLLTTYTWEKWLTDAPSTYGGGGQYAGNSGPTNVGGFVGVSPRNEYDRSIERALGPVPPQMLNVAFNYALPFGPGKALLNNAGGKVASALVIGWQLNGIFTYESGTPITATAVNTLPIFSDVQFPNINLGVPQILNHSPNPTVPGNLYLNPAAFSAPAPFTIGNGPQTLNVRSLGTVSEDLSILRRFFFLPRDKQTYFEFRLETFNTFNRHTFSCGSGTIGVPGFGQCNGVSGGRTAQLVGKFVF